MNGTNLSIQSNESTGHRLSEKDKGFKEKILFFFGYGKTITSDVGKLERTQYLGNCRTFQEM